MLACMQAATRAKASKPFTRMSNPQPKGQVGSQPQACPGILHAGFNVCSFTQTRAVSTPHFNIVAEVEFRHEHTIGKYEAVGVYNM